MESFVDENQGDEIEVIEKVIEPTLPEQDPVPEEIMPEQEDEHEFISLSPIKEQPCIKKVAYVTTNDEEVPIEAAQNEVIEKVEEVAQKSPEIAQKSPEIAAKIVNEEESSSRRRGPRINYADLAAGSPTKTPIHRRGRSASIEEPTPTPKRVKGPRKVMEAIDEFPIPTKAPSAASIELFTGNFGLFLLLPDLFKLIILQTNQKKKFLRRKRLVGATKLTTWQCHQVQAQKHSAVVVQHLLMFKF